MLWYIENALFSLNNAHSSKNYFKISVLLSNPLSTEPPGRNNRPPSSGRRSVDPIARSVLSKVWRAHSHQRNQSVNTSGSWSIKLTECRLTHLMFKTRIVHFAFPRSTSKWINLLNPTKLIVKLTLFPVNIYTRPTDQINMVCIHWLFRWKEIYWMICFSLVIRSSWKQPQLSWRNQGMYT